MSWSKGLTGSALKEYQRVLNREQYHDEAKASGANQRALLNPNPRGNRGSANERNSTRTGGVLLIQTGGTIDKDYPRKTGGYAFEIGESAVQRVVAGIDMDMDVKTVTACRKDSTEMKTKDRVTLLKLCLQTQTPHIIITHGTDTMIETARFLGEGQKWRKAMKEKVIILTGAMKPEKFKDSDAAFNIGTAFGGLALAKPGVYIAMHGRVLSHSVVARDLKTGRFISKEGYPAKGPKSKL
mmetsp:Transcript_16977/g.23745  ORF Transcript_16977/g.23745 Transcript_16977/m.23745 type:complete len:240 (-) Transcript_16977:88-807(-)|eukprot:CAMPEP_0184483258 /NCGR_PEP_ID=MMETSP0113_2-20130426/4896_1 /TAXON_ID=91329 /ORGANISM="Norrisiella sphaerica, Strain BC52" /LENGTH=239 /DNA_ID=CAMNT_0026863543 /DNA_START=53 /DNA_END=772 /DNA_ORIENTATION=-